MPIPNYLKLLAEWKGSKDFDLRKITEVTKYLGNPENKVRCVHVAGTNGKGSTTVATASILGATGASVIATVSPHLSSFNERIIINGSPIGDALLERHVSVLEEAVERTGTLLSFHEGVTALMFIIAAEERFDWMVLEVGLGGRLDSTNVIERPEASIIVTVDYDHMEVLGNSLAEIAAEKAGIIKPGSRVVCGSLPPEALEVVARKAEREGADLSRVGVDFIVEESDQGRGRYGGLGEVEFTPGLAGKHQIHNLGLAIHAARLVGVPLDACKVGVERVFWPARLEEVQWEGKRILLDCAHNPAGVRSLLRYLEDRRVVRPTIIFGALATKNWQEMVDLLLPNVERWTVLTPDSTRTLESSVIAEYVESRGGEATSYGTEYEKLLSDIRMGKFGDGPFVVAGSMYMVGKLRPRLVNESLRFW